MKVLKFREAENTLRVRVDTPYDLWTIQRVIFPNDFVKSESMRRFKASESDVGELKEVVIKLKVERTEFDKTAVRLRIMGKILDGRPLNYVKLNSYHTLNIGPGDNLEITKEEWHGYMLDVVRNAVRDTRKAMLGVIVVDDEKAQPAYLLGYGVELKPEIYSKLSKRMSQKDFSERQKKYYEEILDFAANMKVDTIIVAGPGFTKDDIKKFGEESGAIKKMGKRLFFEHASNSESSGVYELIRSERVAKILERERIRMEFVLMEEFLSGVGAGKTLYGTPEVKEAIENYEVKTVIVNDSAIGEKNVQEVLALAERNKIKIEVFNSTDEVGTQLHSFKDIAAL
jgi:protein pelota